MTQFSKFKTEVDPLIQSTSSVRDRVPGGIIVALIACALLALMVLGGALYVQQKYQQRDQISNGQSQLGYCEQDSFERAQLPLRAQMEVVDNCAAQHTARP